MRFDSFTLKATRPCSRPRYVGLVWVDAGTIKIDTWPCNDFQFNVVTCALPHPPRPSWCCMCDKSEHPTIWEPFSGSLVSSRCPQPRYGFCMRVLFLALGRLYLVSSNVQSCRWSYFLNIFHACLCSTPTPAKLSASAPFLRHLLCGSDYALHLSVLSCFRFLHCQWLVEAWMNMLGRVCAMGLCLYVSMNSCVLPHPLSVCGLQQP